ncbi:MAG: hypothetical protein QOF73_4770 [Thermomicrobiales bacterium]|nr:hypothetical protein [Thermomicrobiales bacterium]
MGSRTRPAAMTDPGAALHEQAALLDHAYDAIFVWDWDGPITFWNRGSERLYGFAKDEAIGRVSHDLLQTHHSGGLTGLLSTLERDGVWEGELEHTRRDGSRVCVEARLVLVSEDGRGSVLEVNRDATARKRAEERLHFLTEASAALSASLDPAATLAGVARLVVPRLADWCSVHLVEADGAVSRLEVAHADPAKVAWARILQERFPYDPNAPRGVPQVLRSGLPEIYPEITDALLEATARTAEELAIIRQLGMKSVMIVPLLARGRTLGAITLVTAESDHRFSPDDLAFAEELAQRCAVAVDNARLYRDAQAAEARYRGLFDGAADAILVFHEDGRYLDANPAMIALLGYERDDLLGKRMGDLAIDGPPAAQTRAARLREAGSLRTETTLRHRDGHLVPVELHATSVDLPSGMVYLAVIRDVTERRRAEAAIKRLNEELEERVRARTAQLTAANQELEAFTYSVSHDLRAPLRGIDGFSRILVEDYGSILPDEAKRFLQIVRDGTVQMGRLVDDLLEFSRLGRQPLQTMTLLPAGIVARVLDDLHDERAGRQVEVTVGDLPACQADPALLKQVFANLLANAFKYTRGREPARIEVGALEGDRSAREQTYFVKDNGVGFDMAYASKLFGVFQRLHRAEDYEGTGVGLALVQRIVHRHGGQIWAEAEVDRGATFWFTLPASAPDDASADAGDHAAGREGRERP